MNDDGSPLIKNAFLMGPFTLTIDGEKWSINGADALEMGMLLRCPVDLDSEPDHHVLEWGTA